MSKYQPAEGIKFEVGPDMVSPEARVARGVKVTSLAPKSPIYADPEVKPAVDHVIADTAAIKSKVDEYNTTQASFLKARTALAAAIATWDGSYRLLVATAEKHCPTADDGTSLGLVVLGKIKYPFVMPLGVEVTYNPKKEAVRVRVLRAPGLRSVCVEMSPDPITPTSWVEIEGLGAIHEVKNLVPGTYWFRAASLSAKAKSEFTTPVSVMVK